VTETRPRRTAAWLLTAAGVVASLAFLAFRLAGPTDGAAIGFYASAWERDGVEVALLPGAPNGLRAGDVVTSIAGRPIAGWVDGALDPRIDRSALGPGPVPYVVRRSGGSLDVMVTFAPHDVTGLLLDYWSALLFTAVFGLVAAYVLWRRPGEPASVALALAAVGVTGSTVPWLLGLQAADLARGWPLLLWALTAGGLYMLLWPAGALHLPLALMSASPPRRRTLALVYGLPLGGYVVALAAGRLASASAVSWLGTWAAAQGVVIVPTMLAGIGLTIVRYRAAPRVVRERLWWVAIGGVASLVPSLLLLFLPQLLTGRPLLGWSDVGLLALPLPIGVAAAILRRGLFEIEVFVNRALVYGGATLVIGGLYVVVVALLGGVLGLGSGASTSLLATGLAAVAALPIRDVLQRLVNRLMFGDRDDPYRALDRLGGRLEGTLDPLETPSVIVRTVAESLRVPWVALRLGTGDDGRLITHGRRPMTGDVVTVPIVYGAEVVGDLLVAPRSPAEPLSAADRRLLGDLARQAGAAVQALALTFDLVESRERLVAAREEERRRIRRDLHDGLGPTLAAVGMRAELAADLATSDPERARHVLLEMRDEVRGAIGDIRRLVDELRPPALDELGLAGALRDQGLRLGPGLAVDVVAPDVLPELPAAVEVAALRIGIEAMTNVARHAAALTCRVRIGVVAITRGSGPADGAVGGAPASFLEIEVVDDGGGLPPAVRPGIGLVSMRERAAEVGGTCEIGPGDDGGTRVLAHLPLPRADGGTTADA
jgi:two-component system NarL family sensor kinase